MLDVQKIDTLAWARELKEAGMPSQQAEVEANLFLRIIKGTMCTKQTLLEPEARTGINLKTLELKLELKIVEVQKEISVKTSELKLEIAEVKKGLNIEIEKIRKAIVQVKSDLSTQIAKWVLGVSLFQTSVLLTCIRFFSLS